MELEHRSPKSRYHRTSRKNFERQLGAIERRQTRIRRIRQKFDQKNCDRDNEELMKEKGPESWTSEYHIGKTQNYPIELLVFAQEKRQDPAAKVLSNHDLLIELYNITSSQDFIKSLKEHLLPRIQTRVQFEPDKSEGLNTTETAQKHIIVKGDRIYKHKIARFYHTTYDIQRSEDVINPRTSHSHIMLLSTLDSNKKNSVDDDAVADTHPFLYARVIGIYHVNVVYIGPGKKDYDAMRFDFLHVRWLQLEDIQPHGKQYPSAWSSLRLNCLSFPPILQSGSFGFVDPALVLRGCHLIPAFASGKRHSDGIGLSPLSRDNNDWKLYYVNRSDFQEIIYFVKC